MTCADAKPLLNAYFDAELKEPRRKEVSAHLEACAQCGEALKVLEELRASIREGASYPPAPAHLRESVRGALRGAEYLERADAQFNWKPWGALAAALAVLALAALPFLTTAKRERQLLAKEFVSAHQRALVGQAVDVVSTDRHTVKPWFNGRLPFSPPVVDLSAEGFPLEGGRVDFAGGHPVAALVYRRRLHRIDLFVWPSAAGKLPAQITENGFNDVSWTSGGFAFTAVSDVNAQDLNAFVMALRAKL